jgi:hypothetical protein
MVSGITTTIRRKWVLSVLCLIGLVRGTNVAADEPPLFQKKIAFDDSVFYVRVSAHLQSYQISEEILNAAAQQVIRRERVFARYTVTEEKKGKTSDLYETALLDYSNDQTSIFFEDVKIIESREEDGFIEALVQYSGKDTEKPIRVSPDSRIKKDGNPSWVDSPPEGSKFVAVVGGSLNEDSPETGFFESDERAIGKLTSQVSKPSISGDTKMYEAVLTGAYIARRWYNPKEMKYYSLAFLPVK